MRTFLIFSIKDNYYALYKDYPQSIYNLLNQIYHLKKDNLSFAKNLFDQLVYDLDKENIDKQLFIKLHRDIPYSKRGNFHFFNNFYLNEITTMEIKNRYIKITSTKDQNYFLNNLKKYNKNLFVCDFQNNDYFFLKKI